MPVTRWTTSIRPANSDYPGCVRGTTSPFNAATRACSSVCRGPLPLVGNQEEESGDYDFVARGHESGSRPTSFADSAGIPGFRRIPIAGLRSSNTFPYCPIPFLLFSLFLYRVRVTRLSSPRVSIRSAEVYSAVPEDDNSSRSGCTFRSYVFRVRVTATCCLLQSGLQKWNSEGKSSWVPANVAEQA